MQHIFELRLRIDDEIRWFSEKLTTVSKSTPKRGATLVAKDMTGRPLRRKVCWASVYRNFK